MPTADRTVRATEILRAEHEVILDVLDCLDRIADRAQTEGLLDTRSAEDALDFLHAFADSCHHGKEEGALFPRLVEKGMPQDVGPVAVMLAEHEQGRAAIAGMRAALEGGQPGEPRSVERFVEHARAYVELLREHIAKENGVLFPMADRMFDARDQEALLERFDSVEHGDMGAGTHEEYLALAEALRERLGVRRTERRASAGHAGACCAHGGMSRG